MNAVTDTDNIVEVRDLVVRYGNRTVLDGLSFDIRRGEVFVILGGSGSGKTTLLRTLVGLIEPDEGSIEVNGQDICNMDDSELMDHRRRMGVCFQGSALFNSMSLGDNVATPLREHTDLDPDTIDIMVKIKLEMVGLAGFEDYFPSELSGGMKKRAGLARALAMDPELMFYDEPSAGLDPVVAAGLDRLIRRLQHAFGITSVVVTHEIPSVDVIADRVCMLHSGEIIALGPLDEVKQSGHAFARSFFSREPAADSMHEDVYLRSLLGGES